MGHCNIHMSSTDPSPLAKWVSYQRSEYKRFQKGQDSLLSLEQIISSLFTEKQMKKYLFSSFFKVKNSLETKAGFLQNGSPESLSPAVQQMREDAMFKIIVDEVKNLNF